MADRVVYSVPQQMAGAYCDSAEKYSKLYQSSVADPESFWAKIAQNFHWKEPWTKVLEYNFHVSRGPIGIQWFKGGMTNVCYNALDRHVAAGLGDQVAFYWEGNEPGVDKTVTYGEMLEEVCKFANVLKAHGIKKGDRVALYLPMILELPIAMLACARIGAMHSVVFGGFSAKSLADRLVDAKADLLVTADGVYRGDKPIALKKIADEALRIAEKQGHAVRTCIVVQWICSGPEGVWDASYKWWHDEMAAASGSCEPEWVDAEHPLFMLYTSGSTGTPKGVVHTTGGYMVYAHTTFHYVFDYRQGEVFFCTGDIGWVTGHTYITYGPLLAGATAVIFEGVPNYPDPGRFWAVCEKYAVNSFYTAPTAIRALKRFGDDYVNTYDLSSLRVLGTVGEPINPEAWVWYNDIVGKGQCAIVDTYWQTETGGHIVTPLPGAIPTKPGSCTVPFFGVDVRLLDADGREIEGEGEGFIVVKQPWPGMMRTVYGNQDRFEHTYFAQFDGYYCTGDGGRRDRDGYLWVTGRVDDVLTVSGHTMGTAELEAAIGSHPAVAEAAAIQIPHEVKGHSVFAYVVLKPGYTMTDELQRDIKAVVRQHVGPFATPDYVQETPGLPKTRSGKIMRRILRRVATREFDKLGDLSTLADPMVVAELITTITARQ